MFLHQEMTWLKGLFTPDTIRNPKLFASLYAYLNSLEMLGFGLALQQQEEEPERKAHPLGVLRVDLALHGRHLHSDSGIFLLSSWR